MKTTTLDTIKHQRIYQGTFPQFSKSSWPAGSLDSLLSPIAMNTTRRRLLAASAWTASPLILPSHVWSADTAPSKRITMGFIGMGTQGRGLLGGFLGNREVQVVAVCDVDTNRRNAAKERVEKTSSQDKPAGWQGCAAYNDFRELVARPDIDAICIATPDHWHAILTVAALKAGPWQVRTSTQGKDLGPGQGSPAVVPVARGL